MFRKREAASLRFPDRSTCHGPRARHDLGRRAFTVGALAAFAAACTGRQSDVRSARGEVSRDPASAVGLWSFFDLPANDPRSRELSGIAWDATENVLWAVQDESPSVVALLPDREFRSWRFGETVRVDIGGPVDLEGLVVLPDGFIVCSEDGPRVVEVDRTGRLRRDIVMPSAFRDARRNKSLESLTASPSGRYLFTTSETALTRDGAKATTSSGTRVRIVRMGGDPTGKSYEHEVSEHIYETDSAPYEGGDWGVADLAALDDDELFVLERGFAIGRGNAARIYQTKLDARASCFGVDKLSRASPALPKTLRVDLGKLAARGLPEPKQVQASPLLDNYEGITLGPRLPDGRASVIVVSDDNGRTTQFARILVLAL
jgi:hypothetical protein